MKTLIIKSLLCMMLATSLTACKQGSSSGESNKADEQQSGQIQVNSEIEETPRDPDSTDGTNPTVGASCDPISNYHQIYSLTQSAFVRATGLRVRTNTGESFEVPLAAAVYDLTDLLGLGRGIPLNLTGFDIPGNQTEVDIVEVEILLDSSSSENKVTSSSEPDCNLRTAESIHVFTPAPVRVAEGNDYLIKVGFNIIDHVQYNKKEIVVCEDDATSLTNEESQKVFEHNFVDRHKKQHDNHGTYHGLGHYNKCELFEIWKKWRKHYENDCHDGHDHSDSCKSKDHYSKGKKCHGHKMSKWHHFFKKKYRWFEKKCDGKGSGGDDDDDEPRCEATGECELVCDLSNRRYQALDIRNVIDEF